MATQHNRHKPASKERAIALSAAPARAARVGITPTNLGTHQRSRLSAAQLAAIETVLQSSSWELDHVRQVRHLATRIFENLREYHGLGAGELAVLESSALLHDVGYPIDPAKHHKVSARIIRAVLGPPFEQEQVDLVAMLARYHRKGIPRLNQRRYARLDDRGRRLVSWLGGILRVADGLDRAHDGAIVWTGTAIVDGRLEIRVSARPDPLKRGVSTIPVDFDRLSSHLAAASEKRDLLERAIGMPVVVRSI